MSSRNFLNIALCFILLLAFIGVPVSQGICNMEFCKKESTMTCCSGSEENTCQQSTEYIQLESDFSYIDASVKLSDISLFYVAQILFPANSVTVLSNKHGKVSYHHPLIPIDIPIQVSCFRI